MISRKSIIHLAMQGIEDLSIIKSASAQTAARAKEKRRELAEVERLDKQWNELFERYFSDEDPNKAFKTVTEYELYDHAIFHLIRRRSDPLKPSQAERELIAIREKIAEEEDS